MHAQLGPAAGAGLRLAGGSGIGRLQREAQGLKAGAPMRS